MSEVNATTIRTSAEARAREHTLRERIVRFWASSLGEPRAIFDMFICSTPLVSGITLEGVEESDVRGWWVRPKRAAPGEAILFIHGGGYVRGSAKAYRGFVSQIVARTGAPAFAVDYPLAPEATLPAGPNAALAAWNWLVAQGFDRIAIVGDSAGGGLTLVTLAQLTQQPRGPAPVAGVVFSPWADLALTGKSTIDPAVQDPMIRYEYLQACARKYLGAASASDPLASPLFGELRGLPPLLIQVGMDDRLLDDSRRFAYRAAKAGVPVQLEIWEGMHHVFQLDVLCIECAGLALDNAARFLRGAFNRDLSWMRSSAATLMAPPR